MTTPAVRHAHGAATVATHTLTLLGPYERVTRSLLASLAALRDTFPSDPPAVRRRRAAAFAAQAVALLDQLDAGTDQRVSDAVRGVVQAAASSVLGDLGRALDVRRGVVDGAVRELVADLRSATAYTGSTARALARAVSRIAAVDGTPDQAARLLERELRDRGLAAVVYKDGSRHGLGEYARMAARTKLAETWQYASLDLFRQAGVTYVEISDGAGCGWTSHDDPEKANGLILTLDEAGAYPLAHPNCGRSSYPRVDVRTPLDAAAASPLSRAAVPDRHAEPVPASRGRAGRLDTRSLAVLAPAAARHAQALARVQARNVAAVGARPTVRVGVERAALRTARPPAPGPGGTP